MRKRIVLLIMVLLLFGMFSIGSEDSSSSSSTSVSKDASDVSENEEKSEKKVEDKKESGVLAGATTEQKNAYKKALSYLDFTPFSHDGLIDQLEFEKFSTEDATWAADNCGADWNEQAVKKGEDYLKFTSFSHDGLIDQLEYEKFTHEQAVYAADLIFGSASNDTSDDALSEDQDSSKSALGETMGQSNAVAKAKDYLDFTAFSHDGLVSQLEYEGFTKEEAQYGADNCGADWNEQAVKKAKEYLDFSSFSKQSLIEQLEYEGFTHEQATYGAEKNGF